MGRRKKEAGAPLTRRPQSGASGNAHVERLEPEEAKPQEAAQPEPVAKDEPKPEPANAPDVPKQAKKVDLRVAPGKSLITTRGVRGPGDDVTAKELDGGTEQLAHLLGAGYLVEVKY